MNKNKEKPEKKNETEKLGTMGNGGCIDSILVDSKERLVKEEEEEEEERRRRRRKKKKEKRVEEEERERRMEEGEKAGRGEASREGGDS